MPPTEKHHGDRGPKPYFHGRNEIIDVFKAVLHANKPSKTGTTFLVHGAPGAGKTALLAELCKVANRWKHARISLTALHDPIAMAQALGQAYAVDQKASLEAGIIYVKGGIVETIAGHATPTEILKCIATKHGLILVLDEAQRLSSLEVGSQEHVRVGDTLSMIHNGQLEMPVMLLAGGLSTTLDAFASFGITRFTRQCKPSLGGLHPHETKSVIRKFLSHEKVVPPLPKWIDAVAKQTHGWPQHIIAYASLLANHLSGINPDMSDTGLDSVLRAVREEQIAYFTKRGSEVFFLVSAMRWRSFSLRSQ